MRRWIGAVLGLVAAGASAAPPDQATLEQAFDAAIRPSDLDGWMKVMAAEPNQVGSPHDKANAEFQRDQFKSWGWDARIETFDVLYPTPVAQSLELLGSKPFRATLQEPPLAADPSTQHMDGALPAYVAFGADGDVTAPLVYVNYGMQEDYATLERLGVDVKGKIVIARYGGGWRGLKPTLAERHGAIGCIIYSDPADDGYAVNRPYPEGPARPSTGIQRGSVADMTLYPGDPLTPGVAATADAKRLDRASAPTIEKIPVLPISYGDAQPLLEALDGPVAPREWRGALPITYHVGAGPAQVHLSVKSDWSLKTIYDVIATIPGSAWPDQWVVRGNHHDGWVFGATDPLSGQVALMAEAKAIGALLKTGWRPKRTLVYASWDAEEPMLVGSTEWVEAHADELRRKAVLYVNSDENGRGFLDVGGSQDWQHLANQVAADVTDPETGVPVGVRHRARVRAEVLKAGAPPQLKADAAIAADPARDFPIHALGSGSDFSPFLQHLGVPALNLAYGGEGEIAGIYHSAYDTYAHHSRFVDPGFVYDALLAKTAGRLVLRAAQADLPPQRATDFADAVSGFFSDVKALVEARRKDADSRAALLRDQIYRLAADPTEPAGAPPALPPVPAIAFGPLEPAVSRLQRAAGAYDSALATHGAALSADRRAKLQSLMQSIDQLLAPDAPGLPERPWYRNLVYAPGRWTGYGAKTLPGVREAIEEGRWADAEHFAQLTAAALDAYAARLEEATKLLR